MLVYQSNGVTRLAVLDHSRLFVAPTPAPTPESRFARLAEEAILLLPTPLQVRLRRETTCIIDEEDSPVDPPIQDENGTWKQRTVLGRYWPGMNLITLYERNFERLFPGADDRALRKHIKHVLEHELAHAGGLSHEAMGA